MMITKDASLDQHCSRASRVSRLRPTLRLQHTRQVVLPLINRTSKPSSHVSAQTEHTDLSSDGILRIRMANSGGVAAIHGRS